MVRNTTSSVLPRSNATRGKRRVRRSLSVGGMWTFSPAETVLHHTSTGNKSCHNIPVWLCVVTFDSTSIHCTSVKLQQKRTKINQNCFHSLRSQDKHCSREALLAGLKLEEQQAQSPNQTSSQYVHHSLAFKLLLPSKCKKKSYLKYQ